MTVKEAPMSFSYHVPAETLHESVLVDLDSGKCSRNLKLNVLLIRPLNIKRTDWLWDCGQLFPKCLLYVGPAAVSNWLNASTGPQNIQSFAWKLSGRKDKTNSHLKIADLVKLENGKARSKHSYGPEIYQVFFSKSPVWFLCSPISINTDHPNPNGSQCLSVGIIGKEDI